MQKKSDSTEIPGMDFSMIPCWIKVAALLVAAILLISLLIQISDFLTLKKQILSLESKIQNLSNGANLKTEIQSDISILKGKVNRITDKNLKNSLGSELISLSNKIDFLPEEIALEEQLRLERERITLGKDLANTQNSIYNSFVQTVGGLLFLITAFFTWRNIKIAQESLRVSEEKQVTERFGKAVDHLGSERVEVRIGGVYELKRIAKDSMEKDYRPTIEILTGFIRERSRFPHVDDLSKTNGQNTKLTLPATDIETALNISRELNYASNNPNAEKKLDLRGSDFSWMILQNHEFTDTNLERAVFYHADLQYVNFNKSTLRHVDFRGAILNFANLSSSILDEAVFSEIDISTGKPINTADMKSVIFYDKNSKFEKSSIANFRKANLCGVDLSLTDLEKSEFVEAILVDTKFIAAILEGANFSEANLTEADFSNANLNNAIFCNNAILKGAVFTSSDLSGANLSGANLSGANLSGANLSGANLSGANLSGVELKALSYQSGSKKVISQGANFKEANLEEANFMGVDLSGSDFRDAKLANTNFKKTDLTKVFNLTQKQLNSAITSDDTKLPDYLEESSTE